MQEKAIGMKDVAKRAGVSIATVSYVLNHTKPVSRETKEKVEEAMKTLNFQPNLMARSLKTQKTGMVGVIIPDLYSLYFTRLVAEIENSLIQSGFQMILCNSQGDIHREEKFISLMMHQLEGVIVAPAVPSTSGLFSNWNNEKCPIVYVDRKPSPITLAPYVVGENENAGTEVFNHLYQHYENLAVISPYPAHGAIQERISGFMSSALRKGITPLTSFTTSIEEGRNAGRGQIDRILTMRKGTLGVFCTTNSSTIGCVSYLKSEGVSFGSDVGVVGYDDSDWMLLSNPTISAVRTNPDMIGKKAAEMLLQMKEGNTEVSSKKISVQLIIRESSFSNSRPTQR